jgi:hypothetical protein
MLETSETSKQWMVTLTAMNGSVSVEHKQSNFTSVKHLHGSKRINEIVSHSTFLIIHVEPCKAHTSTV